MSAGMAFLHDHGGKLRGSGRAVAHARTGSPLSQLADSASSRNLSSLTHAVLYLVSNCAVDVQKYVCGWLFSKPKFDLLTVTASLQ